LSKAMERIVERKAEHVHICATMEVEAKGDVGWDDVHLIHECLPEIDRDEIDTSVEFCGHRFRYPLLISALTGGYPGAAAINENLAQAAEHFGIGMELGSQRPLIDFPELEWTYSVARQSAPNAFLVANIGAPQLIPQQGKAACCTLDQIQRFIDVLKADALAIHLNFLQESVMPEGNGGAKGCVEMVARVARSISIPLMVKETGAGISKAQALRLGGEGVFALDVAGAGGTNMAVVESHRAALHQNPRFEKLGRSFASWGIPTVISVIEAKASGLPVVASGGIRSGLDAAKAIALGADLVGVATPLLRCAVKGYDAVVEWLENFFAELSIAMFLTASPSIEELRRRRVIILGGTKEWLEQLGYDFGGADDR
jgi:isopentenyl-diphosphate delta-isomerase